MARGALLQRLVRARDYLHAEHVRGPKLDDLARESGLSRRRERDRRLLLPRASSSRSRRPRSRTASPRCSQSPCRAARGADHFGIVDVLLGRELELVGVERGLELVEQRQAALRPRIHRFGWAIARGDQLEPLLDRFAWRERLADHAAFDVGRGTPGAMPRLLAMMRAQREPRADSGRDEHGEPEREAACSPILLGDEALAHSCSPLPSPR